MRWTLPLVAGALAITSAIDANAYPVPTPLKCLQCAPPTYAASGVPSFAYNSEEFGALSGYGYLPNISNNRYIVANAYVNYFSFYVAGAGLDLEPGYDFLYYGQYGTPLAALTGTVAPGWYGFGVSSSLQQTPGSLNLVTDYSVQADGFHIEGARVCCKDTPSTLEVDTLDMRTYHGVLVGTNDVVYFKWPAAPTGTHETVAVTGYGADVDLWVACNANPTYFSATYRSEGGDANEFLHLDATHPTLGCASGYWHAAVFSFSGNGQFKLARSRHFPSQDVAVTVGVATPQNATTLSDRIYPSISSAAGAYYSMTDGVSRIARVDFWNTGSCNCNGSPCQVCYQAEGPNPPSCPSSACCFNASPFNPQFNVVSLGSWSPQTLAHEWGHCLLGLPDEYARPAWGSPTYAYCEHSAMGGAYNEGRLCVQSNHNTGFAWPIPSWVPSSPWGTPTAAWDLLYSAGVAPIKPLQTPDPTIFYPATTLVIH